MDDIRPTVPPNQPSQLPPHHVPKSLKLWLLALAVVLLAALSLLVWQQNHSAADSQDEAQLHPKKTATTPKASTKTTAADPTADWKTYTNIKYLFSVKYSPEWALREYPADTANGVAFRLASTAADPSNELISLAYFSRTDQALSLAEYSKVAAIQEIEGYQKQLTNKVVTTDSGIVGYETTWEYQDHTGATKTSGPIVYFPTSDGATTGVIELSANVQATPLTSAQLVIFEQMVKTFTLQK